MENKTSKHYTLLEFAKEIGMRAHAKTYMRQLAALQEILYGKNRTLNTFCRLFAHGRSH